MTPAGRCVPDVASRVSINPGNQDPTMRAEPTETTLNRTPGRYSDEASPTYALQPVTPGDFRLPNSRRRLACIACNDTGRITEIDPVTGQIVAQEPIEAPERVAA